MNSLPPTNYGLQKPHRDGTLDVIRCIACVMVVMMHSPIPSVNANGLFLSCISYFTAPCIGLFFMVSGALLLPIKGDMFSFLKRRFTKIVFPLLFWTAIYLSLKIYNGDSELNILRSIASTPFSAQGHGVLWFLYTMVGLYLLAPVLTPWLRDASKRELEFVLILWAITLCYPLLEFVVVINDSNTGILYYFTGYAGYFLLGHYLQRYRKAFGRYTLLAFAAVTIIAPVIVKAGKFKVDFYELFWYLSIFVALLCVVIYRLCQNECNIRPNRLISSFANYSFGIYLCHIMIMREFLWKLPVINNIPFYPLQWGAVVVLTLILSLLLCRLIAIIPHSAYIIGVGKK